MHDLIAPALGAAVTIAAFAGIATQRYLAHAYRAIVARGTEEAEAIVARADAYYAGRVGAANLVTARATAADTRAHAFEAGVRATVPALLAAAWRPPREPVAVEVAAACGARDTPVSGQPRDTTPGSPPPPLADWPDLPPSLPVEIEPWFTLDDPPSGRRAIKSPLAHSVAGELVPFHRAAPTTPPEPRS